MKKKIIYSDDFLGDDAKVKVVKDFLPSSNELVLKKDFRNRFEVPVDSLSMPQANFREAAVA
ncbi:MAG: hypothetical protein PHQ03_03035 [Methylococcales bacterium]|nr:hypothetical protein [Methylococcales bacterium]